MIVQLPHSWLRGSGRARRRGRGRRAPNVIKVTEAVNTAHVFTHGHKLRRNTFVCRRGPSSRRELDPPERPLALAIRAQRRGTVRAGMNGNISAGPGGARVAGDRKTSNKYYSFAHRVRAGRPRAEFDLNIKGFVCRPGFTIPCPGRARANGLRFHAVTAYVLSARRAGPADGLGCIVGA
ncbi:hypothetical protein EVAR_27557_1 [Eumeta japonica]|uniref:Uncharacterized protein n=1 Tax=Eumeta variegata TaxID=151549 RepID=A0A4C1WAU8_EUMVA|nr:hypothetical protein EVAR_27557_1 [Eumeta japonica]